MKRVLFICTHNSARSQMAEALVNHRPGGKVQAFSAGTEPSFVHPLAVAVMQELGIDISRQRSKSLDEFEGEKFDYVITLCNQAEKAARFSSAGNKSIWAFPIHRVSQGPRRRNSPSFGR